MTRRKSPKTNSGKSAKTKGTTKPQRGVRRLQSSPITVGGGSVKLKFDEDYYRPGAVGGFIAVDELITVLILDENNDLLHNLYQFVEGKNCTVKIHCKYRGQDRTIEIDSKPGGPLVVRFDVEEFPHDSVRRSRYNGRRKITDPVQVVNNDTDAIDDFPVPRNGKCGIIALNRF
jgi:hypothetical protein